MPVLLVHSDRFAEHQTPPGHPERPERAEVMDAVAERWRARGVEIVAPRAATSEQLLRVHAPEYLRRIADTAGRARAEERYQLGRTVDAYFELYSHLAGRRTAP